MRESDDVLLDRARAGSNTALAAITRRYQDSIFTMVWSQGVSTNLAATIAEDIFVEAFRGLPTLPKRARFDLWLYRKALDVLEGYKYPLTPEEASAPGDVLRMKIGALPADTRAVLILLDILRLPENDVSEVLRISCAAVRKLLHRGRASLVASRKLEAAQAA